MAWQFAQRTSHFAISALSLSKLESRIMSLIAATLIPRTWSNSRTRISALPQSTHPDDQLASDVLAESCFPRLLSPSDVPHVADPIAHVVIVVALPAVGMKAVAVSR